MVHLRTQLLVLQKEIYIISNMILASHVMNNRFKQFKYIYDQRLSMKS